MAFNIAQVGVDKKSGAPIIQRSSNFIYNNDPNGTRDIFYYFGSRLRSSTWVNPNTTSFITASRLNGGSITGPATVAVDNNPSTNLFTNSTDETDGFQVRFLKAPFKLLEVQLNTNDPNWTIEGSNDGTNWTVITYPGFGNLGNNWFLLTVTNSAFYSYYRILHDEPGFTKTFGTVKFFGEYQSGDIAPGIEEDATFLATHRNGPGIVYLPDAGAESFPENYYCTIVHFKSGEYTYQAFPGGGTSVIDNTNGVLRQGEQLLAVYDNGNWELFKVGSGVDLITKGTLITSDGTETTFLSVGPNGSFLVADSTQPNGLRYQTLNLSSIAAPTATVNFGNQRITGVGAPTSPTDAVTKNYADSIAAGLDPKASCDIATTGTLNATTGLTWTPAGSGAGKTLTSNGTSATIDTILLQNGLRVLVKDQTNAADNGIYLVSGVGTAVTLTRASDFNNSTNVTPGAFTFITNGVANGATGFILLGNGTLVVDTNPLNFSQFAGAGAVTLASLPDTNLTPLNGTSTGRLVGWNDASGFFELYEKAGTGTGDLVKLVDNGGTPAYPALDGTLINISPTQVSPLTTKGDLWVYNGTNNTRLPVGVDNSLPFANSATSTGFQYRAPSSNDLDIAYTPTEFQFNFVTGVNTVELGPLHVDDSLAPNDDEFLRYDAATSRFVSEDPTGTNTGDIVVLEDVGGNPGLPAVDGSQLTNLSVGAGQGSPLTTKGDVYIHNGSSNIRLPVGADDLVLTADSTTSTGLAYKKATEPLRKARKITTSPYIVTSIDERQVLEVVSGSVIELRANVTGGFFTIIKSAQSLPITFTATNGGSITQNSVIYNKGDIAIVHSFDGALWTISVLNNNILLNKGELPGFTTKPEVLSPGTTGQILTINSTAPTGFRWENRAEATDLIYAKKIPVTTLNHTANDIFEYIGRNRDISFTNTFTNPADGARIIASTNTTFGTLRNDIVALTNQANGTPALQLQQNGYGQWHFQTVTVQPYEIAIYHQANPSNTDWNVQVSNNGTTWATVGTLPANGSTVNTWVTAPLTTNGYYSYLRVINTSTNTNLWANEVKLFGWVKDNPAIGEIFAIGTTGITPVKGSNGSFLMADSSAPNGVRFAPNSGFVKLLTLDGAIDRSINNGSIFSIENDIIDYLTTQQGGNPNGITINVGTSFGASNAGVLINQSLTTTGILISEATDDEVYVEFVGATVSATEIDILVFGSEQDILIQGTNDPTGTTWNTLYTWDIAPTTSNFAVQAPITDNTPYKYFRFTYAPNTGIGNKNVKEIGFYGIYTLDGTVNKTVTTANINKVHYYSVANESILQIDVPTGSFNEGDYFTIHNTGAGELILNSQLGVTILNEEDIVNSIGFTITHTNVVNTWVVTSILIKTLTENKITTAEKTLSSTKTLTVTDASVQVINPNGANREVILPDPPIKDLYFKIVNADAANFNINIKETAAGPIVKTLDINTPYVECHRTQNNWLILD